MESGVEPQSGYQQKGRELNIPPLHTKGVLFQTTFSQPMMIKATFTEGPSTHPSYTKPSCSEPTFTEHTHTEIPLPQESLPPNHAPWMDLSTQISSLRTRMKEFAMVSDTRFYSMEDRMDQYQVGFTSQFEYLQHRIECIEDRLERQNEEMMTYLCSMFPPPPPPSQP